MVSAEIDRNLERRQDEANIARWAPPRLRDVARLLGRTHSAPVLEDRLGISASTLRQRGKGMLERNSTVATGGAAVSRSIAPTRNLGLDAYGTQLLGLMNVEDAFDNHDVASLTQRLGLGV